MIDGNRDQHLQNGGCNSIHPNGKWFCQGREGHELVPPLEAEPHFTRLFSRTKGYEAVSWA